MNNQYFFTHNKEDYSVDWDEEDKVLTLNFCKEGAILETKKVPLIASVSQEQLDQIVKDYWKWFKKNYLLS